MSTVERKGDMSRVAYIEFHVYEFGVTVCVHPDKTDIPTRETVRFCAGNAGGRSPHVYAALAKIELELNTVGESGVIQGEDGRIVLLRNTGDSDFVLKTDSLNIPGGGLLYGARVLFTPSNPDYELVEQLLAAVTCDNKTCPIP